MIAFILKLFKGRTREVIPADSRSMYGFPCPARSAPPMPKIKPAREYSDCDADEFRRLTDPANGEAHCGGRPIPRDWESA